MNRTGLGQVVPGISSYHYSDHENHLSSPFPISQLPSQINPTEMVIQPNVTVSVEDQSDPPKSKKAVTKSTAAENIRKNFNIPDFI